MPTSDEDLQKLQEDTAKLRGQVKAERAKKLEHEQSLSNDITAGVLKEEQVRLQAQLAELKATSSASAVKDGAAAVLDPEGTAEKVAAAADAAGATQPPANPREKK